MKQLKLFIILLLLIMAAGNAQTIVTGTLLGSNGKPMINSCVVLKLPMEDSVYKSIDADKDGKFKIKIDSTGVWILHFTGVSHTAYQLALYVDKPGNINVNIRLQTYQYLNDFTNAKVVGKFNDWMPQTAVPMKINHEGIYEAEIYAISDTTVYRLVNVAKGDFVEGTNADVYAYNKYDGYNSLIFSKPGKVKITFNPSKLVKSPNPVEVVFSDPSSQAAQFAGLYDKILSRRSKFMSTLNDYGASGKDMKNFRYDWSTDISSLTTDIKNTKNEIIKQTMLFSYLELISMGAVPDSVLLNEVINNILPSSLLWALHPGLIQTAAVFALKDNTKVESYLKRFINENNSIIVKTNALASLFYNAKYMNKPDEATEYYRILTTEYGNTPLGSKVKRMFSESAQVKIGSPVPSFSFVSIDDSTKILTNESLKGKNYLIDFWATWCGPCVNEMKSLHDAYEKYKGENFTIVSISFDNTAEDVVTFRGSKWKMPWFNSYLSGAEMQAKIRKNFDIVGIPSPILVNDKGIVVALQADLRGDILDNTVGKLLSK